MSLSAVALKIASEVAAGVRSADAALALADADLERELLSPEFEVAVESARRLAHVADPDRLATRLLTLEQSVADGTLDPDIFSMRAKVLITASRLRRQRSSHA